MREERLFQILGQIDGDFIVAADTPMRNTPSWGHYTKLAGWAASLMLLIGLGSMAFQHAPQFAPSTTDELPVLTLEFLVDGMGFEGYQAYDYTELKNANPWSEELDITHLPVFQNSIDYAVGYEVENPDWDAMEAELLDVATRFGMENVALDRKDVSDASIEGVCDDMSIDISYYMTTTIYDNKSPEQLPAEFEYQNYNMPYEKYYTIAEYLQEEYTDFIDMENPCINVHGGDYDIYANQSFAISFYDASEDPVQRIINYNFNQIHFYPLDGTLDLFRVEHPDLSNVVGNYPIISEEAARALLIDHVYATTVPYDFPGEEYIRGCELVYRTHILEKYYIPYYRFYVELPEIEGNTTINAAALEHGLITYGAYYVPAVEEKYIENMPVGELKFN